jgi:hypothetical protein
VSDFERTGEVTEPFGAREPARKFRLTRIPGFGFTEKSHLNTLKHHNKFVTGSRIHPGVWRTDVGLNGHTTFLGSNAKPDAGKILLQSDGVEVFSGGWICIHFIKQ